MSENVGINGIRFSTKEELRAYANAQYSVTHTRKVSMPEKKPYYVSTSRQIDLVCNDKFCWCLVKGRREKGKGADLKDRPWYIQEGSRLRHYNVDEDGNEMPCAGGKKRTFSTASSVEEGAKEEIAAEVEDAKPQAATLEADIPATPESVTGEPKARKRPTNATRNDRTNIPVPPNDSGNGVDGVKNKVGDENSIKKDTASEVADKDIKAKKKNAAADKKKK